MKKRIGLLLLSALLVLTPFMNISAENEHEKAKVYMFRGEGCGFCSKALSFFDSIEEEYGKYFELVTYETWKDKDNKNLMLKSAKIMGDKVTGVPYIIIGKESFAGFDEEKMGDAIKNLIVKEYEKDVEDRFDIIEEASKPVKRNVLVDVIVVVSVIASVVVILLLRKQNVEVIETKEQKVETKKIDKEIKEDKSKKKTIEKEKKKTKTSKENK